MGVVIGRCGLTSIQDSGVTGSTNTPVTAPHPGRFTVHAAMRHPLETKQKSRSRVSNIPWQHVSDLAIMRQQQFQAGGVHLASVA